MSKGPPETPRYLSYWAQWGEPTRFPVAEGRMSADVAVVGGGITGLTTALMLKRAGHRVVVLEAARVGGGATGGAYGRLSVLEAPVLAALERERGPAFARLYADAVTWGMAQIADTVEGLGIPCGFTRRPIVAFTTEAGGVEAVDSEVAAARRAEVPVEAVLDSDLPFPIEAGAYLPDQAQFDPLRYCRALARAVDDDHPAIFEGSRVVDVSEEGDRLVARTAGGARIDASWVVMACGLPPIDRGGFFARTVPLRAHCVALEGRGSLPVSMAVHRDPPARWLHSVPRNGGPPLLFVGGEDHFPGDGGDARDRFGRLEAYAREHFPVGEVVGCWSSQDYATADGVPMVGRVPFGSRRLLVATGLGRAGLALGPTAARILSDLVMGRPSRWAGAFAADRARFTPSSWDRVRAQATTVGMVGRHIPPVGAGETPESLAPGTGGICVRSGEPVAAFRDWDGTLRVLTSACTHRGCPVAWNPTEQTWDCPCHGSRFGTDGRVLHGPATKPLEPAGRD